MSLEYRSPTEDEFASVLLTTHTAFGEELKDDDIERHRKMMPRDRMLAAWDGGRPVGVTGSYPFELTTPGGVGKAAGVSWVGVLPSHRRRGILRELMLRQLDDVHARGEPFAILYASESLIYGRFGYGMAVLGTQLDANRARSRCGTIPVRAARCGWSPRTKPSSCSRRSTSGFDPARPGYFSRSEGWWREYRLADPEHWREGAGPKYFALLELDGEPAGFAHVSHSVEVGERDTEGRGSRRRRARDVARRDCRALALPLRHRSRGAGEGGARRSCLPLLHLVQDPRRLSVSVLDGLWLRLVDLEAALRARSFADSEPAVLEVTDSIRPGNAGRWSIGSEPGRTDAEADVALDVADLSSVYLGAFSFERLAAAGRARELRPGGLARATALFATPLPPYCPEGF